MSKTEQAWNTVEYVTGWRPYGPTESEDESAQKVNNVLRQLQQERLTVRAIELIGDLLKRHSDYILQNSWCAKCGVRADGTDQCQRCHEQVDSGSLDSTTGLCTDCSDEEQSNE